MPFALRLNGRTIATFDTEQAAVRRARALVRDDADCRPEIVDAGTGQPAAPAASDGERDELAREIGF